MTTSMSGPKVNKCWSPLRVPQNKACQSISSLKTNKRKNLEIKLPEFHQIPSQSMLWLTESQVPSPSLRHTLEERLTS